MADNQKANNTETPKRPAVLITAAVSVTPNSLKKKRKTDPKITHARNSVSIIRVSPPEITGERMCGFIVCPHHFMVDKWMALPIHKPRGDPAKAEFTEVTGCVPRVVFAKTKNGNTTMTKVRRNERNQKTTKQIRRTKSNVRNK